MYLEEAILTCRLNIRRLKETGRAVSVCKRACNLLFWTAGIFWIMAGLAGQVGLQLLLTPSTSNFIFKGTGLVVGTAFPIYASFSLLESKASSKERDQQAAQWLTYWAVYGVVTAAEQLFEYRPPLYYHVKFAFLFWLQSSRYQGARRLYALFLRPFLLRHKDQIDSSISFVSAIVARPEISYVGNHIHNLIAKVPYLNWFVQPFDDTDRSAGYMGWKR